MTDQASEMASGAIGQQSSVARLLTRFMVPVSVIVFAAPFIVLMFYAVPAADDFCNASLSFNTVPQPNVLTLTWLYYTQWSPRWLSAFVFGHAMSHGDMLHYYGWLLLLAAITNVAALWYFFSTVFRLTPKRSLLVAAVFYSAWVASLSNPDQQIYWLTNVIVYNLPLTTLLVLVSLLLRPRSGAWYYVAVALLSIAVPAQQEIAGMLLCMFAFSGAIVARLKRLPASQWYLSLCLSAISFAAVILSPGNAARAAVEHKHLWDIRHFPHWFAHAFFHGITWLTAPAILIAALGIFLLCQRDSGNRVAASLPSRWIAIACLFGMFAVLCECALIEVATSSWLPDRVVAWFQFVFWLLFVCVVASGAQETSQTQFSLSTKLGVFSLLLVALLGSMNFRNAMEDVRGPAQSWWRVEAARLSQRGGTLEYEAPAKYPKLAKPQMLTGDPGCWVNVCLANYLHATRVVVNNSHEECPH